MSVRSKAIKRRSSALVAGGAALALVAACGGGSSASSGSGGASGPGYTKDRITVGITNALTGPGGSVCGPFTQGAKAYFDSVNSQGGVLGHTIDYKILDDAYDASRAVANMRELLNQKMLAFVGGCGTIQAAALAPALSAQKVPYLFPYAGLRSLVQPTNPYVYGLLPLYEDQIKALVPHAFGKLGAGSVYMAANEWPGYQDAIDNAKSAAEKGGGKFLGSVVTKLGTADYTPLVLKIKAAAPDYVVIDTGAADAAKLVNSLVEQNALPKKAILGVSTLATGVFAKNRNQAADKLLLVASPVELPAPAESPCAKALNKAGVVQEGSSAFGCVQAEAFVSVLKKAGTVSRDSLLKALDGVNGEKLSSLLPDVTLSADDHMGVHQVFIQSVSAAGYKTVAVAEIKK
jgi:branched-chain amino acid transport system substrate-binding protein